MVVMWRKDHFLFKTIPFPSHARFSVSVSFWQSDIGRDARRGNRARRSVTVSSGGWSMRVEIPERIPRLVCVATGGRGHIHSRWWLIGLEPGCAGPKWRFGDWEGGGNGLTQEENKMSMGSEWQGYRRVSPSERQCVCMRGMSLGDWLE